MQFSFSIATASLFTVLALIGVDPAGAAPTTSEEIGGQADAALGSSTTARTADTVLQTAPLVPQSKTVELLLQLQDQPNALSANDGPRADTPRRSIDSPGTRRPAAASAEAADESNPLANLKAAILGHGTGQAADGGSRESADPDSPGAQRTSFDSPRQSAGGARSSGGSLLANPVVRFIRENRMLTVSVSLGVLAAIWLTANFTLRRSR